MCQKPMLCLPALYQGVPTVRLIGVHANSPYKEVIVDPLAKLLILVTPDHKPGPRVQYRSLADGWGPLLTLIDNYVFNQPRLSELALFHSLC